jgi:uncharacterized protein YcbK (DUF882 family)
MITIVTNLERLKVEKISRNFSRHEFKCSCCDFATVDVKLIELLEVVRNHFNQPVKITSGCRCVKHNKSVGGAEKSKHLYGIAADIKVKDTDPEKVYDFIDAYEPERLGVGLYKSWVHVDVRPTKARWGY